MKQCTIQPCAGHVGHTDTDSGKQCSPQVQPKVQPEKEERLMEGSGGQHLCVVWGVGTGFTS